METPNMFVVLALLLVAALTCINYNHFTATANWPTSLKLHAGNTGVVIVGIFKNEAEGLEEWCKHYLEMQGVKHLYLIDNNSTDLWQAAVAPYRERLTVFSRPRAHAQSLHYNSILPMLKQKHLDDWVFVLDIDEYLYPSGLGTIASVVQTNVYFQTHAHISIRWKMFGSSGKVLQPPSIRCSFVNRMDENNKEHSFSNHESIAVKSGVAIRYLQHFNIHSHVYWNPDFTHIVSPEGHQRFLGEDELASGIFQLNHYPIQSLDWFTRIKMTRGSASSTRFDHVRDVNYFAKYDHNELEDRALANQIDCYNSV
jgi:hypothetical protein